MKNWVLEKNKRMNMVKKLFQATTIMVLIAVGVSPALAGDSRWPGLNCEGGTVEWGNLRIGAPFSTTITACPVTETSTSNFTSMFVRVDDTQAGGEIRCSARACNSYGTTCSATSTAGSGVAFTGNKSMSLGSLTKQSGGYTYIRCEADPIANTVPVTQYRLLSYRAVD